MGVFSDSKDRAKATLLIKSFTENSLYFCEKLDADFKAELAPKLIHNNYPGFEEFFAAIAPEVAWIKQLVDELKALDSATRLIIEKGSPSMRQMMILNASDLERCMDLIYDQAMIIERYMLESNLVPAETEGIWFKEMVHSEFEDYSEVSKDFVTTVLWNIKCFR